MFNLHLEKAAEPEIKLPTSVASLKKQESSRKHLLPLTDYAKAIDCVDHHKLENSEGDGNTRPSYLPPEKPIYRSNKEQLEPDMEKWSVQNWERSTSRLYSITLVI